MWVYKWVGWGSKAFICIGSRRNGGVEGSRGTKKTTQQLPSWATSTWNGHYSPRPAR